jgi:hypothetical protein
MSESVKRPPLEDLMVAMDVVDTLRHRDKLVTRELDADGRRERLIDRLREIYAAQGIEVTDTLLEEGVRALEEDRFAYSPTGRSFSHLLAGLYVKRGSWGKPLLISLIVSLIGWTAYHLTIVRPESVKQANLPSQIERSIMEIRAVASDQEATEQAEVLHTSALAAIAAEKFTEAEALQGRLNQLLSQLQKSYRIKIVSGPNEKSGVWRIPDINTSARNYYLIVEAIDDNNKPLVMEVTNEESGKTSSVKSWGLRVDQSVFNMVAEDKRDDGIIQKNVVGVKERGKLKPSYSIMTSGDAITEW